MGSYDNILKLEQIRKKVEEGDLETAQKIVDTMDVKKIKNILDINLIAEVYEANGKYEEARELYLKLYEKTHSRKSLFNLINIIIKLNDADEAQYYYEQYKRIAPDDFYNYIFRYCIEKIRGASYDSLIGILEELKKQEYIEKWAYELAKLYYKEGMEAECIRECSDIILWFGEGPYVEKAKLLRSYYMGEADKEKIMQEIKRRAGTMEDQPAYMEEKEVSEDSDNADEMERQPAEGEYGAEEEYSYDFEYNLSQVVQNYMNEETGYYAYASDEYYAYNNPEAEEEYINDFAKNEPTAGNEYEYDLFGWLKQEYNFDAYDLFADYLTDEELKYQLIKGLENILMDESNNILMLISGSPGSGKTSLAKKVAIFLNKIGRLKTDKLAKINADKLNEIDIFTKKDVIRDCCLVIENASILSEHTLERVLELSNELPFSLPVVFEENTEKLNKLFEEHPVLMDLLQNRICLR